MNETISALVNSPYFWIFFIALVFIIIFHKPIGRSIARLVRLRATSNEVEAQFNAEDQNTQSAPLINPAGVNISKTKMDKSAISRIESSEGVNINDLEMKHSKIEDISNKSEKP